MRACGRVDELSSDAHSVAAAAHAAFDHVIDAKVHGDLGNSYVLALVLRRRLAGHDEQIAEAGELGDDLLGHAVGEIFLFRIATEVGERQHRDPRPLGYGLGGILGHTGQLETIDLAIQIGAVLVRERFPEVGQCQCRVDR